MHGLHSCDVGDRQALWQKSYLKINVKFWAAATVSGSVLFVAVDVKPVMSASQVFHLKVIFFMLFTVYETCFAGLQETVPCFLMVGAHCSRYNKCDFLAWQQRML